MTDRGLDAAREVLARAVHDRIAPAAVAEVGASNATLWREAFGRLTLDPGSPSTSPETVFDLASLTKPVATTSVILALADRGALHLAEPVAAFFKEWRGADREAVTLVDLLEHASGLPARLVDRPPPTRREFEHDICALPLEYVPRTRSIYSDLGFILLGFVAEDRGRSPLAKQFQGLLEQLRIPAPDSAGALLAFDVRALTLSRIAPTLPMEQDPRRGRMLVGEVHDDYAAALGGTAGHAGLFGTAGGVAAFARAVLRAARGDATARAPLTPATIARSTAKTSVPSSSRALGWDTMSPSSSCGTKLSTAAFGHTGFTGTSLWIDPVRDRYFVLLTNRVCGEGTVDQIQSVRRAFHDALGSV
jgi:CubicO group peptidase (beta-lactamase class C family)